MPRRRSHAPWSWLLVVVAVATSSFLRADAGEFIVEHDGKATAFQVPQMLDCDELEEWRAFRLAATSAVEQGFVHSQELREQASVLEERWRPWVCSSPDGVCQTTGDLGFSFVRELHRQCRDSNNFQRYLIRHYFDNAKKTYEALEAPSGFCLYGYVTALVVLSWHEMPGDAGQALRYMYTARHLLGHYHSFDFLESSTWPVASFLIHVNVLHMQEGFIPLLEPPDYNHPGQDGPAFYFDRLRWTGTTEAAKPNPGAAPFYPLPFDVAPPGWRGKGAGSALPRLVVWQFCIHTSTAGEAVTMISRFLGHQFDIEWRGNSVAKTLCSNYWPSLCAQGRNAEFLDWLSGEFTSHDLPYSDLSQKFQEELLPQLQQADVWMCSIPAVWCRLLDDANRAVGDSRGPRPIFVYLGLPILQYVARHDREDFLGVFSKLTLDHRNVVVANNPYLAEEVLWHTGLRIPTVRIHGLHTNTTWLPLRNTEVLVSRPGTSGGWQECILMRFVDANPDFPLRFVQFTHLLDPATTREVYNTSLSYPELAQHRAVVGFPYDTSLMFFWEFYSMNMPIFVPFQLWRWGVFGQHTRPDLSEPVIQGGSFERPPHSMYFDGFGPLDVDRSVYWSRYTDWAMFPHVQYFASIPDLMAKLLDLDLQAISASMKRFNEESIVQSVATWRYIVERWLDTETFTDLDYKPE